MKVLKVAALLLALLMTLTACGTVPQGGGDPDSDVVDIALRDDGVTVDGTAAETGAAAAVYVANDIVYYEQGHDFTYGEGTEEDAHSAEEAAEHTVVHITKSGTYRLSGTLSRGQIAVDLGEDAADDPAAVVTLILDGADITCAVAPAIIFYRVYECGSGENPSCDVDTTAAGANILLADGSTNTVRGAYVSRIYKADTVVLSDEGTSVADAKKLHKYDGAVYSKMTMNVSGGAEGTGVLNIYAENEGLDTEMHLTINGGNINIFSGNDGINTNEDGVSVTTVNGGTLSIVVTGDTGEGDGIDSNGWLVINGGTVIAAACANSADAGIDSDMGIHINGGTALASGNMLDRIEDGGQTYAVFTFTQRQQKGEITLKNAAGDTVAAVAPQNDYAILILSTPDMTAGTYTLWRGEAQLSVMSGGGMGGGFGGMMPPDDAMREPMTPPEGMEAPEGFARPEDMTPPEGWDSMTQGFAPADGAMGAMPQRPNGEREPMNGDAMGEAVTEFTLVSGGNMFTVM